MILSTEQHVACLRAAQRHGANILHLREMLKGLGSATMMADMVREAIHQETLEAVAILEPFVPVGWEVIKTYPDQTEETIARGLTREGAEEIASDYRDVVAAIERSERPEYRVDWPKNT
jgi:hypothetical protein